MNSEEFRQSLINAKTPAESKLLSALLRDDYLKDKFEFQKKIGKYFVDFCFEFKKLIVEVDGSSHDGKKWKDQKRTHELSLLGYKVMRVQNITVHKNINSVVSKIFTKKVTDKKRKSKFFKDHINKDIYINKGSKVVRRKRNPAPGRKQANIDLL